MTKCEKLPIIDRLVSGLLALLPPPCTSLTISKLPAVHIFHLYNKTSGI